VIALQSLRACALLALLSLFVVGCGTSTGNVDNSTKGHDLVEQLPLSSVQETTPVRGEDVLGVSVNWVLNQQVPAEWGITTGAEQAVQEAISSSAVPLAAVDYVSLSLPQWVTYTRALNLEPSDFTGKNAHIDAHGESADKKKWLLYEWQGPEFPQDPARTIVHRWVTVYALYDVGAAKITRLIPTIRGVVYE